MKKFTIYVSILNIINIFHEIKIYYNIYIKFYAWEIENRWHIALFKFQDYHQSFLLLYPPVTIPLAREFEHL